MSKLSELPFVPTIERKAKRRGKPLKRIPHHTMPKDFYLTLTKQQKDLLFHINDRGLSFNAAASAIGCSRQYLHQEYSKIRDTYFLYLIGKGLGYQKIAEIFNSNAATMKVLHQEIIKK